MKVNIIVSELENRLAFAVYFAPHGVVASLRDGVNCTWTGVHVFSHCRAKARLRPPPCGAKNIRAIP